MNGHCEAEIDDFLYDEGEYFNDRYMQDGKLRLFAHFVAKSPRRVQREQPVSDSPELYNAKMANMNWSLRRLPSLEYDTLDSFAGFNVENAIKVDSSPRPHTRPRIAQYSNLQGFDQELDDNNDEFMFSSAEFRGPEERATVIPEAPRSRKRRHQAISSSEGYDALPIGATAAQFLEDIEAIMLSGPPPDSRHYRRDYQLCSLNKRRAIAHALLLEGDIYGVEAIQACASCVRRGEVCRIYHPDMQILPWKGGLPNRGKGVGMACAMCRTHGPASPRIGACCAS